MCMERHYYTGRLYLLALVTGEVGVNGCVVIVTMKMHDFARGSRNKIL